jgi:hypothetical protein
MAGRFQNNDAQRSIRRINGEISVDKQDMKDFVNVAKAHAAAGNMGDFVTILSSLGRLEQQNDVTESIKQQNAEDRKILLTEIDARLGKVETDPQAEEVPMWAKDIMDRLAALEK